MASYLLNEQELRKKRCEVWARPKNNGVNFSLLTKSIDFVSFNVFVGPVDEDNKGIYRIK
jgi:hypothetical protein